MLGYLSFVGREDAADRGRLSGSVGFKLIPQEIMYFNIRDFEYKTKASLFRTRYQTTLKSIYSGITPP